MIAPHSEQELLVAWNFRSPKMHFSALNRKRGTQHSVSFRSLHILKEFNHRTATGKEAHGFSFNAGKLAPSSPPC
jgi:hypothetical protein